ncbi:hypothetical protein ACLB2K_037557 [Fragaria x ananassa]
MFDWILKKAQERYKDWKYQCHKAYMKEGSSGMSSDFIGREDQWEFLCEHFESDAFKRLSLANKRNRGEKTMHHHTGSSPIIYTMKELRIQGAQLPIDICHGGMTWLMRSISERMHLWNNMHPDATEEEIIESFQSQQIEVLGTVLKTRKGKEIRGMRRGGERDLSHSLNGSTSRSRPPRVDEQQLREVQERYEQRLKESEERAQLRIQEELS